MMGTVSSFDDDAGLGTITADDGTVFAFHCTAIEFETRPAPRGTWEAGAVRPR